MNNPGEAAQMLRWTAQTHAGRVRRNNEDSFLCLRFDESELNYLGKEGESPLPPFKFIFAVSDGMGGENAGEFASRDVTQSVSAIISREYHQGANSQPEAENLRTFCQQIHDHARRVSQFYDECKGMGATLSLGWLDQSAMRIVHLGDSRIYHLPADGGIKQLTEDHTAPGRMFRDGRISEREARTHPLKSQLERSIGCHSDPVDPQIVSLPITPGDLFLFCSDGITDGLWNHSIEKILRNPPPYLKGLSPAQAIVKEALEASGRDNLTAVVLEVL